MPSYKTYDSKGMKKLSKASPKKAMPRGDKISTVYENDGYKTYDSGGMEKIAKERLAQKMAERDLGPPPTNAKMRAGTPPPITEEMSAGTPPPAPRSEFAPLERDLPRGGRQMKIAEPLGAAALPEAAASGLGRVAGMTAAGMLIPSSIGEEQPMVDTGNKGVGPALPSHIKGSPRMEGPKGPTQLKPSKDEQLIKRFEEEGRKHMGPEFKYEYDVEDQVSNPPEHYKLKMKSDKEMDELSRLKGVGMHNVMRKNPKLGPKKSGMMNIEQSPNRTVELEEDED